MLKIRQLDHYGFPILHVSGVLDLTTFGKLMAHIGQVLDRKPRTLGLDLSEITRADAAAVSVVAAAAEWMSDHGGRLKLLDTSPVFERALRENARWLKSPGHLYLHEKAAS